MIATEFIVEHDRIGTALWKNSVPAKYKQFPIIGQGATSVLLDSGNDTVIVLTRDAMKKDWLCQNWGLGVGEWVDQFNILHRQSRELSELTVYAIKMPKLYPLSLENKRVVTKAIKQYYAITNAPDSYSKPMFDKMQAYLDAHPEGLFTQLAEFLQNYDDSQYSLDFIIRNFMQDGKGNIVLTDPIVSTELTTMLHNMAKARYNRSRW